METSHEVRLIAPDLHPWEASCLLDAPGIELALQQLPGWHLESLPTPHRLTRTWKTPDFASGLLLLTRLGALAEAASHHPDVALGWGYLRISWTTHDLGGIHANDVLLAAATDRLFEEDA